MRHLHLILIFLLLLLLSTCRPSGSQAIIDQINVALGEGRALEAIAVHNHTDQAIVEVIQKIHRAQQAAASQTIVFPETEAIFHAADSLADQIASSGLSIWTDTQIGFYYYRLSQLEKAFPYFLKSSKRVAVTAYKELIDPTDCFIKNAYFFGNIGDHAQSIDYLSQALLFVDTTSSYATIQFALGAQYLSLGDYTQGEQHFIRSKNSAKQGDPVRYAKALGELALLAMEGGDLAEAETLLHEDIRLSQAHGDERNTMFARIRLARIYIEQRAWDAAKLELLKAEEYVRPRSNLIGFDQEITLLKLTVATALDDQAEQLVLHQHLQSTGEQLKETDGEKAVMRVNLALQRARAENDILTQKTKLQQSKMNGTVLLAVCLLLLVIALFLRRSKKQALRLQEMKFERTVTKFQFDKMKSESKYAQAQQTIQSYLTFLKERNAAIDELKTVVAQLQKSSSTEAKNQQQKLEQLMQEHLMTDENWHRFKTTFIMEHAAFYTQVHQELPNITESQLRIVLLQKLRLNNQGMANLLGVGQESIKKAKQRLRKKYGSRYDQLFDSTGLEINKLNY